VIVKSKLTKEEKSWLRKVQNLLNQCPSERLGFYTLGDPCLFVYDRSKDAEISKHNDSTQAGDFGHGVEEFDASFDTLKFPSSVHSVAG
jgi:hypothetical protein